MRLYIGNILYGSGPTELRAFLVEKGVNLLTEISWPRDNNGMRPFCFIDVDDDKGEHVISELHGQVFNGRPLRVNAAHPRT